MAEYDSGASMRDEDPSEGDTWRGMTPQDRGFTTPMIDDAFAALADWRRRAVCHHLLAMGTGAATVETLNRAVAQRGQVTAVPAGETTLEAVRLALVETHLPLLHDLGILDYDERSAAVRYWGSPTVEKWLEHTQRVSRRVEF